MRLTCSQCGKPVSTEVPEATIVRAWVECPECSALPMPEAELLRLAAQIAGKRSAGISRGPRPGTGRPLKLSPCPVCGVEFGVAAMRNHKCGTL